MLTENGQQDVGLKYFRWKEKKKKMNFEDCGESKTSENVNLYIINKL